jgi:hypothetical protein
VRAKGCWFVSGLLVLATSAIVRGQEVAPSKAAPAAKAEAAAPSSAPARPRAAAATSSGPLTGPASVAPHWSRYLYPATIPEGALYHLVVRGDTLWDLSKRYLANAYLWPQLWHENGYIKDAHWIYPGDPILLPRLQVVAGQAGAGGENAPGGEGVLGADGELLPPDQVAAGVTGSTARGQQLLPLTEPTAAQCAPYIPDSPESQDLKVVGHETGETRVTMATGEILYINRGTDAGVKPGDVFSIHRLFDAVSHPKRGRRIGQKVLSLGWARVILSEPNASSAVIVQACQDIHGGDYLLPFKPVPIPMIAVTAPADRLTPHTDKAHGYVVDLDDRNDIASAGQFAIIDLGSGEGISPGTVLQVYRIEYPSVPTPRNVIGDLAVLTVQERTATAKIIHSTTAIMVGDEIEVR